jgi:hypothetical protein
LGDITQIICLIRLCQVLRHAGGAPELLRIASVCRAWAAAVSMLLPETTPTFFALGSDVFVDDEGWLSHSGLKMRQRQRRERRARRPAFFEPGRDDDGEPGRGRAAMPLGKDAGLAGRWLAPHEVASVSFSLAQGSAGGSDRLTQAAQPAVGVMCCHPLGADGTATRLQWTGLSSEHDPECSPEELTLELRGGMVTVTDALCGGNAQGDRLLTISVPQGVQAVAFALKMSRGSLPARIKGGSFAAPRGLVAHTKGCQETAV